MRLSLLVLTVILIFAEAPAFATTFSDVSSDHWAWNDISYFSSTGVLRGYTDGRYGVDDQVKREQMAAILIRTFYYDPNSLSDEEWAQQASIDILENPSEAYFEDVPRNRIINGVSEPYWAYRYIETCKDYLTGYENPFNPDHKPIFMPDAYATREEITVALLKIMKLSVSDVRNANYAKSNFKDGDDISPGLVPYVSLAVERGLISGFPDGTFKPNEGITRAQVAVLIGRATKQAVESIAVEPVLRVTSSYSANGKTITLTIISEENASVSVDNSPITMRRSSTNRSEYRGTFSYTFTQEDTQTFMVTAEKGGRVSNFYVDAKYEIGVPTLTISSIPQSSTTKTFTVKGTVSDPAKTPALTVESNGVVSNISVQSNGSFSTTLSLENAGINTFKFVASSTSNPSKISAADVREVVYNPGSTEFAITSIPGTTTSNKVTVKGTLKDDNYTVSLIVSVNDKPSEMVTVGSGGGWSADLALDEGVNDIEFAWSNSKYSGSGNNENGAVVVRQITFTPNATVFTFEDVPLKSTARTITFKGTLKDDNYDVGLIMEMNGQKSTITVPSSGNWSKTVNLNLTGETVIKFTASRDGKEFDSESFTIEADLKPPILNITHMPTATTSGEVTVEGYITGAASGARLYINGALYDVVDTDGTFRFNLVVEKDKETTYTLYAQNDFNVQSEVVSRKVTHTTP